MNEMKGKLLTVAEILAAEDRGYEEVVVPEWGGSVRVAVMSGADRDMYEEAVRGRTSYEGGATGDMKEDVKRIRINMAGMRALLVSCCLVDDAGARLFSAADVAKLDAKSGAALDRVYRVAMRLNGLGAEDQKEIEGNSREAGHDARGSASPNVSA